VWNWELKIVRRNGHVCENDLVESCVRHTFVQGRTWRLLAEHWEDCNAAQQTYYCPSRSATLDLGIELDWESLKNLEERNCHRVKKVHHQKP